MKVSKGRGIQFFKHPVFVVPQRFVVGTYNAGKNKITSFTAKTKKNGK